MVMVKKLTHSDDDVKRYVGAVTEQFTDGLKALGEQYFDIKKSLNSHTEMIGDILVRLEESKNEFKQKVDYKDFAKLQVRVAHLEVHGVGRH